MRKTNTAEWVVWTRSLNTCATELRMSCMKDGVINETLAHEYLAEASDILDCLEEMATTDE